MRLEDDIEMIERTMRVGPGRRNLACRQMRADDRLEQDIAVVPKSPSQKRVATFLTRLAVSVAACFVSVIVSTDEAGAFGVHPTVSPMTCAAFVAEQPGWNMARVQATGIIDCGGKQTTANLVGDEQTIVFSAHGLVFTERQLPQRRECHVNPRVACHFQYRDGDAVVRRWIDPETLRIGHDNGRCILASVNRFEDWAVARLMAPIPNASFYLPPEPQSSFEPREIIHVSGPMEHLPGPETCWATRCAALNRLERLWKTNCLVSGGASGGANVVEKEDDLVILAITIAGSRDQSAERPYHVLEHAAIAVPIEGPFLDTLLETLGR